jgi:hypothetical protein
MQPVGDTPGSCPGVPLDGKIQVMRELPQQAVAHSPSYQVDGKFRGEKAADLRQAGLQIARVRSQWGDYSGGR